MLPSSHLTMWHNDTFVAFMYLQEPYKSIVSF